MEGVRAQLEEMKADHLAGKFPEDRESILSRLGYGDYDSYRGSPVWRRTRRRILRRDGHICVRCGEKATEVHHQVYTEAVLKGEDDSRLVSLCAACHTRVEFDENGVRRTDTERRRVLEDREGARQEKIAAEQARLPHQETQNRVRDAAGGRCAWCKGDTENRLWQSGGSVYALPTIQGEHVDAWLCSGCRSVLEHDKDGRPHTDEQKVKLLSKKPNVRYARPEPHAGFSFTKAFERLNAMQRKGIMNEFKWNAANIKHPELATADPKRFAELKARYESTRRNGRDRRERRKVGP